MPENACVVQDCERELQTSAGGVRLSDWSYSVTPVVAGIGLRSIIDRKAITCPESCTPGPLYACVGPRITTALTSPYKGQCVQSNSALSHVTNIAMAERSGVFQTTLVSQPMPCGASVAADQPPESRTPLSPPSSHCKGEYSQIKFFP